MQRDHTLKLRRALSHLEYLQNWAANWTAEQECNVEAKPDPKRGGNVVVTAYAAQPPADPLAVVIGECLHNMRSALDLLAYELALDYSKALSKEIADKSEFPVIPDKDSKGNGGKGGVIWTSKAPVKIQGIDPKAQAEIKALQPYHAGTPGFLKHPLWVLHELDRVNKHRLLHAVAAVSQGVGLRIVPGVTNASISPGVIKVRGGIVGEHRTEVAEFPPLLPPIRVAKCT